jgi:predicted kinase
MTTLTATRGLPASGKTTFARHMLESAEPGTLVRLNRDDLRASLHGKGHYTHVTEKQITTVQHGAAESMLRAGVSVVVDDTNLRSRHLRTLAELAWRAGAEFAVEDFTDVPLMTCLARNAKRQDSVPDDVITGMHQRYLAGRTLPLPLPERPSDVTGKPYVVPVGASQAVMVDIDGTVALHGDRDPYDTSRYHEDTPNYPVVTMVYAAWQAGHHVIMCSGREETFRDVTEQWLKRHMPFQVWALHMRPAGDKRRDDVVKLELFDKHIRDEFDVTCVFDDRARVVDAWRSLGLTVLQVAEGNF